MRARKSRARYQLPFQKASEELGPEEENGQEEDEKEGSDDYDVEKYENCPKFHATPLL